MIEIGDLGSSESGIARARRCNECFLGFRWSEVELKGFEWGNGEVTQLKWREERE